MGVDDFKEVVIEILDELDVRGRFMASAMLPGHKCGGEIKMGGFLHGVVGRGMSRDEAKLDLIENMQGVRMVWGAYGDDRKEIQFPAEWGVDPNGVPFNLNDKEEA